MVEFPDQTSPFSIAYNDSTGWVTYTIVADPPGKTPSGSGKVTLDGTTVEFIGGGAPTIDAVATPTATHVYNVTLVAGGTMSGVFGGTPFKNGTQVFSAKEDSIDGTKLSFQYALLSQQGTWRNVEWMSSFRPRIPRGVGAAFANQSHFASMLNRSNFHTIDNLRGRFHRRAQSQATNLRMRQQRALA
jgi:hypothetical protein